MADTVSKIARRLGRRGGRKTLATHGLEYYRRIGRMGYQAKHKREVEREKELHGSKEAD